MSATVDRVALERTLTQRDFDRFARLSGDDNPIHVDPGFAARTRFGRTVAHGLLLDTVLRGLAAKLVPDGRQVSREITFSAPTYAGEPMRFSVEITDRSAGTVTLALACERVGDGEKTCVGEATMQSNGGGADA